jgi:N4-gp56 family major capsid protein
MAETLLAKLINPEVMADMVSAELKKKLQATRFIKVDNTLTGRAGNTITVPTWAYIGEAADLPENAQGDVTEMATSDKEYTIKKAVKNVSLTDEAVLSGYGDPIGEATRQLRMSIQDKIDSDAVEVLEAITALTGHLHAATGGLTYDDLVDALDLLALEEQGTELYLMVNHTTVKNLRKDPQFIERQTAMGDAVLTAGVIGQLAGCNIIISNKLTDTRSYILTPNCLTAFMKRGVTVETQREMLNKRTIVGSDCHYVVAIEDYDKIVAITHS